MEAMTGSKIAGSTYRIDGVHTCPRCDGSGTIWKPSRVVNGYRRRNTEHCNLCKGRGVLFYDTLPERIEQEEYLSDEGKLALNNGDSWTLDQELDAMGYSSREESEEDGFEPARFLIEPAVDPATSQG
jgi:hypothetical protein